MILLKFLSILFLVSDNNAQNIQPYIINGESVGAIGIDLNGQEIIKNTGEFPYMVSVDLNGGHLCGGVIIAENAVLTAEHCVHGVNSRIVQVKAGTLSLYRHQEHTEQLLDVHSITSHPYYRRHDNLNDIAILWLKGRFIFNKYVNKINLSELIGENYIGEKFTVIGWGSDNNLSRTKTLKKAGVEVIEFEDCRKILFQFFIPDCTICVIDKKHIQTTCPGDSGGPMIRHYPEDNKKDLLIGITSAGLCDPKWPILYTDIGQLKSWIIDEIRKKKLGCNN